MSAVKFYPKKHLWGNGGLKIRVSPMPGDIILLKYDYGSAVVIDTI